MAEEPTPTGAPRRKALVIGRRLAVTVLAAGIPFVHGGCDAPERALPPEETPTASDKDVARPDVPSFRFRLDERAVIRTTADGKLARQDRRAAIRAADAARTIVTDLYVEAFLDPGNWVSGSYDDAFGRFTDAAAREAMARLAVLTAGPDAADRFERITRASGALSLHVLADRAGTPVLISSDVRFNASAIGEGRTLIRSRGRFLLERVRGVWRVVSFQVTRSDEGKGAA